MNYKGLLHRFTRTCPWTSPKSSRGASEPRDADVAACTQPVFVCTPSVVAGVFVGDARAGPLVELAPLLALPANLPPKLQTEDSSICMYQIQESGME